MGGNTLDTLLRTADAAALMGIPAVVDDAGVDMVAIRNLITHKDTYTHKKHMHTQRLDQKIRKMIMENEARKLELNLDLPGGG